MNYEFVSIIVGVGALFISVVAIFVSYVFFVMADKRASDANKLAFEANVTSRSANDISKGANEISNKALGISLFTHRKEIEPKLTANYIPISSTQNDILLSLKNEARGNATVHYLQSYFTNFEVLDSHGDELELPFELGQGQRKILTFRFNKISARIKKLTLEKVFPIEVSEKEMYLVTAVQAAHISVYFEDEMKTKYKTYLTYDWKERKFIGLISKPTIEEVSEFFPS